MVEQPCLRADFLHVICKGSCNYFSQRQINHLTLDGTRRIEKTLPEELNFAKLISLTEQLRGKYDVRASQGIEGAVLWTLDVSMLHNYLIKLKKRLKIPNQTGWRAFLDTGLPMSSQWQSCVKDLDEDEELLVGTCILAHQASRH